MISLKDFLNFGIKLFRHLSLHLIDPLLVAFQEVVVLILNGLHLVKLIRPVAFFVIIGVFDNVVREETLQQVKFEVILQVEVLAHLSLREIISLVLVAVLHDVAFQFIHPLHLEIENDSIFQVYFGSLQNLINLLNIPLVHCPLS